MEDKSFKQETGLGHNINAAENSSVSIGDLIVTSLLSSDLVTFSKQFLLYITHRNWNLAAAYLSSLQSVSSLDSECRYLLELFEYKLNISQGKTQEINNDVFIGLLRSQKSNTVIKDIVESIYIQYLSLLSKSEARDRYINSPHKSSFTEEVYYEKIATQEELSCRIIGGLSDVYEYELCSLLRGALRCKEPQVAVGIAENLIKKYSNENSEILLALSYAYQLNSEINGVHYWLIPNNKMKELDRQTNECLSLSNRSNDSRIIQVAAILLSTRWFEHQSLLDLCSTDPESATKVIPSIKKILAISEDKVKAFDSPQELSKNGKLSIDRDEFIRITSSFFEGRIRELDIKKWLIQGVKLSVSDQDEKDLMYLMLACLAYVPHDEKQKQAIEKLLDSFINSYLDQIQLFNIQVIHQLCNRLNEIGLHIYTVKLLEPMFPPSPWISPALDSYAEALLGSEQLEKLDELFKKTEGLQDSFRVLAVKAQIACSSSDFIKAINIADLALTKYQDSCYFWGVLLNTLYLSKSEIIELELAISKIPMIILKKYSEDGLKLLHLIAQTDLSLAESITLEWFIDEPVKMAIHVTNLHFSSLQFRQASIKKCYPSNRCSAAVVYSYKGRNYTKLLVENSVQNEYMVDTDTPIGILLKDTGVGEEATLGMKTYQIVEKIAPIVGAFRISSNIRDEINPGTDVFYQLSFDPDDPESLLEQIKILSKEDEIIEPEIEGKPVPLIMRLARTHKNDLVRGAFHYLTNKESNKSFSLFSKGENVEQSVVLDTLSLVYFSLTGFCHGLIQNKIKLYITKETNEIVSNWLQQVGAADYLSIGSFEGRFTKTTAKDIEKESAFKNLGILLTHCDILLPLTINMPEMLMKIRDYIDVSHYSSLKISLSHSIPFLCMDSMFCTFYDSIGVSVANANKLIVDAHLTTPVNEKRNIECYIYLGLAAPIVHNDVIELCKQKEKGQYLASEILKRYPNEYASQDIALRVLVECCLKSICSAYLGTKGEINLSEWRFTEHIVYASCTSIMQCLEGNSYEKNIAILISEVLIHLTKAKGAAEIALTLFNQFAIGHFLNIKQINIELNTLFVDS